MKTSNYVRRSTQLALLALIGIGEVSQAAQGAQVKRSNGPVVTVAPGDCAAVNLAIESLPAEGGTIRLQAGTYTCSYPIVLDKDNVSLIGAGAKKTIVKAKDLVPMPVVIIGVRGRKEETILIADPNYPINKFPYPARTVRNVILKHMTIDGNFQAEAKVGQTAEAKECWQPDHGKTEDCGKDPGYMVRNNGLTIRRSEDVLVSDLITRGAYSGGIVIEKKNKRLTIEKFVSTENFFDGFAGYETQDSIIRKFSLVNNHFSGASIDVLFEHNLIEDGEASFNGDNGVFSADIGKNVYRNLRLIQNKNLGFYLDGEREQPSGLLRPNTCNANRLENVVIEQPMTEAMTKAGSIQPGIMVNHACLDTEFINVRITHRDSKCITINELATGKADGVICSNGKESKTITGRLPQLDGLNVFQEPVGMLK